MGAGKCLTTVQCVVMLCRRQVVNRVIMKPQNVHIQMDGRIMSKDGGIHFMSSGAQRRLLPCSRHPRFYRMPQTTKPCRFTTVVTVKLLLLVKLLQPVPLSMMVIGIILLLLGSPVLAKSMHMTMESIH